MVPIIPIVVLSLLLGAGCTPSPSPPATSTPQPGSALHAGESTPPPPTPTPTASRTRPPTLEPSLTSTATATSTPTPTLTPTPVPPQATPSPSPTAPSPTRPAPTLAPPPANPAFVPTPPAGYRFATLDEFWTGAAEWMVEVPDTGLPVGESDTVHRGGEEFWSYLHASYESAGVIDSCGDPAPFPGCVTLWKSYDGGLHFSLENPRCLFSCGNCPCDPGRDHVWQQQYPRVFFAQEQALIAYEWGAGTFVRTSPDGIHWSAETHVPGTGQWDSETTPCTEAESIGDHPNIYDEREFGDCLVGAPPGITVQDGLLYIFVGLGRDPGHMGCLVGDLTAGASGLRKCESNPLLGAVNGYGPLEARGAEANPYFEFRTISSADVVRVGERYYMTYEGVRGPSDPSVVDDQFALGFARSVGPAVDGPWETYPGNPLIADVGNNWGIGHADIVVVGPATYLYTTTSHNTRGRYVLVGR